MPNKNIIFAIIFWTLLTITTFLLLIEVKPAPQTWPKDKVEHAIIFALLTYFAVKSYSKYALYICFGLADYGGIMEIFQSSFTQTRTGSINDWLADLFGVLITIALLSIFNKKFD